MRTLTVYVAGQLKPETWDALGQFNGDFSDFVEIPTDDVFAYGNVIARYWSEGKDFAVVEPDIVVRADVIDAFRTCPEGYCAFPYPWLTDIGPALGCTRFRHSFIAKYPTAVEEVIRQNIAWNQFDVVFMRHILARKYGEQPHVHLPPVQHLNERKQLMEGASTTPLMSVPHW